VKLHEYQAKELLARFGVPVPAGKVAFTPEEAKAIAVSVGVFATGCDAWSFYCCWVGLELEF
jgi:succinyl-CoA synthetase beta subunit